MGKSGTFVLRNPGLVLALHFLDASVAQGRCLIPRMRGEWLPTKALPDLHIADRHGWGCHSESMLSVDGEIKRMVARSIGWVHILERHADIIVASLREVVRAAPLAVGFASCKVVDNGMPMCRRVGTGEDDAEASFVDLPSVRGRVVSSP